MKSKSVCLCAGLVKDERDDAGSSENEILNAIFGQTVGKHPVDGTVMERSSQRSAQKTVPGQ